jgi:hypothetical protein
MPGTRFPLAVVLSIPAVFAAGDATLDRATLRGLKAVNVVIEPFHPELERQGLNAEQVQMQIETRLQDGGIAIDNSAREFLALRVLPARQKNGPYGIAVAVGLYQPVQLARDVKIKTATDTWGVESVSVVQPKLLSSSATRVIAKLVDAFIAAYWAVNSPK